MTKSATLFLSLLFGFTATQALATKPPYKSKAKLNPAVNKMNDCDAPLAYTEFALNNVRIGLETSGKVWNRQVDYASYEVPKVEPGSGELSVHSIYSGGLWIGGKTPDGDLKMAAVTFRDGGKTDYYSGPLSNNGFATADYCPEYDRFYKANRTEVAIHKAYYDAIENGNADELFPDGYTIPEFIQEWPGNNPDPNYEFQLAPFVDRDGDLVYEPEEGDYPMYDLSAEVDCETRGPSDPVPLFGDETVWWVFNDNGGSHTETQGDAIGMEIQAQAFAYSTTDEINNMTFYNYVLINRGVQTLTETYFGHWLDTDLGFYQDDYVGCDVQRGMGYTYNGYDNDVSGQGVNGYGLYPPALGVDFFEGPYQDPDDLDNPISPDPGVTINENGIPYEGLGVGYGDGIVDNERFGMSRFVYYNNDLSANNGEPEEAIHFYNYLLGKWKNGESMTFGADGQNGSVTTNYMFPGDSDPLSYGTYPSETEGSWTEHNTLGTPEMNEPADRRFLQSAGPFTLDPGEYNNITTGIVWVRPFLPREGTLQALRRADDKAQALFDNCFQILSGPDAPELSYQELDNEIILYLSNDNPTSNNYLESYGAIPSQTTLDITIPEEYSYGGIIPEEEKHYKFQGYMIYQLKHAQVSSAELDNPDLARLQVQVDIQDGIGQLINWADDPELGLKVPYEAVNGADEGLSHSFSITQDLFATSGSDLVNFKKYYFMAIAYAHNEYEPYNPSLPAGQPYPFLGSRKSATGGIPVITAMPHNPSLESGGTVLQASYGDLLPVTQLEGQGNAEQVIHLSDACESEILASPHGLSRFVEYEEGTAPIEVKVIDPIKVARAEYRLGFIAKDEDAQDDDNWEIDGQYVGWYLIDTSAPLDTIYSHNTIDLGGEQLILDKGISLNIGQYEYLALEGSNVLPQALRSVLSFEDSEKAWLTGVADSDGRNEQNWIRSGTNTTSPNPCDPMDPATDCYYFDKAERDPSERYENVLDGIAAPWHLVADSWTGPASGFENFQNTSSTRIENIDNADIVFTSDKSLWSRVPVLENQHFEALAKGQAQKLFPRIALSVDKDARNQLNGGDYDECTMGGTQLLGDLVSEMSAGEKDRHKLAAWPADDPDSHSDEELAALSFGMGWFPGYAIDVAYGERLNMAFSENSALASENGADMIWNPSSTMWNFGGQGSFDPDNARFGGMHYIYLFENRARRVLQSKHMPAYDEGHYAHHYLRGSTAFRNRVFRSCTWVLSPLLADGQALLGIDQGLIPTKTRISLRVAKPYKRAARMYDQRGEYPFIDPDEAYTSDYDYHDWDEENGVLDPDEFEADRYANGVQPGLNYAENDWLPLYAFDTYDHAPSSELSAVIENALLGPETNVVPNPYYGRSNYETARLDTRVKIVNLPRRCIINIYTVSGLLVRTIDKDNELTYAEWDLKNERNVPIASGVHIFHIEVPGITEKVVKWMGVMRPVDLDNF